MTSFQLIVPFWSRRPNFKVALKWDKRYCTPIIMYFYTIQCNVRFDVTDLPYSSFELLYPNTIRGSLKVDLMSNDWIILLALVKNVFVHKKTQFVNCQHHSSLHTSSELLEFQFKIWIEGRGEHSNYEIGYNLLNRTKFTWKPRYFKHLCVISFLVSLRMFLIDFAKHLPLCMKL